MTRRGKGRPADEVLAELHASLDARRRPEDVARLVMDALGPALSWSEGRVIQRASRSSLRETGSFSSMSEDFARPVDADRQLATLARVFGVEPRIDAADPAEVRRATAMAGRPLRWAPDRTDFLADRLDRAARAAAGVELTKRQYNRQFRLLRNVAAKADRMERELLKRTLIVQGRSGLVAEIPLKRFRADPDAACFVAYYAAKRNLRREFSLAGKDPAFDEIARMLLDRCEASRSTDWWMISRAYPAPDVVARLSDTDQGEMLGRWSAQMRVAAELLEKTWAENDIDRDRMVLRRGNDSSTWNTAAQAFNSARTAWLATLAATGTLELLDVACPGKVMRLMAGDLVWWHGATGGDVDPDTAAWAALPLPWEVLDGRAACTRSTVAEACRAAGVDPVARGWTAPTSERKVGTFRPTPELVHGVTIADPAWALLLRDAGVFSGKRVKPDLAADAAAGLAAGVVASDLPLRPATNPDDNDGGPTP